MAAPIFIAVNQTAGDVQLVQLALLVPASGQTTLSNYNTTSEIQDDAQLRSLIESDVLLLNDGVTTLTKAQSLQVMTPVTAPTPLNPMTAYGDVIFGDTSPAGAPKRLAGVNGAYLRSKAGTGDPTFTRSLDVDTLVVDTTVGATPDASAAVQVNSTTKGFLKPRVTEAQMQAIASPATGLMVFNTTQNKPHFFDGTSWRGVQTSIAHTINVAADGSADFTSIQDAIDSVLDASPTNIYQVQVAPGEYVEDVALANYIYVQGEGWESAIRGTVTATNPEISEAWSGMQLIDIRIVSTNAPAFILTGTTDPEGEADLLGCFLVAEWDETAAAGDVRCVVHQDSGRIYAYKECSFLLNVTDTTNVSASTIQTFIHTLGTDPVFTEIFNTWCYLTTDNPGNSLFVVYNSNTNTGTDTKLIGYGTTFELAGTAHANPVHGLMNVGNGMHTLHATYIYVDVADTNTVSIHGACCEGAPDAGYVVASQFTVYKVNVADANVYLGSSSTTNDVVQLNTIFYLDTDVKPLRYTDLGTLGSYTYSAQNNFGTSWASGLYNGAEVNADVTDWDNVSGSLGGQAGASANYVFKSDGAGGGSMVPNKQTITRRVTVGLAGDVDYTSIKTAIEAAIAGGANASNWWQIEVYPGTYTEAPMVLQNGITLVAMQSRMNTAIIVASNAAADLFTCTGGYMAGFVVRGVTDSAKALFRMATASTQTVFHGVSILACSTGWAVSNGAACLLNTCSTVITGPSQSVTTWASVSGSGSYLGVATGFVSCVAALLPYYAGNPIQTVFRAADGSKLLISGASYRVAPKNSTADIILADTGAQVTVIGVEISDSGNGLHIGSAGSDTKIIAPSVAFTNNLLNVFIESSTGVVFANFSTDIERKSIVSGGKLLGLIQYRDLNLFRIIGNGAYRFASGKDMPLEDYFYDFNSTATCEGGEVTAGTGLHVDVAAGEGFIRRGAPEEDAFGVSWEAVAALALTASTTNYVVYDSSDSTVKVVLSAPGVTGILLATVVTDGSGIRFLHSTRQNLADLPRRLFQYLYDTRKFATKTGLATSQGSGATKLEVGSGIYYLSIEEISYGGSGGDATWSYFYGTNGATEVASVSTLNTTQYDNAGTLSAMTAGYFRADTLYLTSDGRLSLIYGKAQYSSQAQAEDDSAIQSPPTFVEPSGCRLVQVVVQQGVGIASIIDRRPNPGAGSAGGGGGTNSHSALADLDHPADHTWAFLVDGTRAMTGDLNMGTHNVTNVGTVDGVTVSNHKARHAPGGSDAIATGTPVAVSVGASPAEGSAASLARSDHQHGITSGTPQTVGTSNSGGSASTVARSDHVHDHGSQSTSTHHAVAIAGGDNGFMSGTDKTKLDGIASGATNTPLTSSAPVNVTKAAAAVGVATDAARSDHKHDITTATAGTQAPGDTALEGVATSIARSDHRHSLPAFGTGSGTFCQGNDSRLSDARTPTAHATSHKNGGTDEVATATAAANAIPKAGAGAKLDIGWLPTGSTGITVCIGNDSRLSDARTPTAHATSHKNGGTDEVATATAAANAIPKAGVGGKLDIGWLPTGSTSTTVCIGNDARLSDARTPTSHHTTHESGGSDVIPHQNLSGAGTNTHAQIDSHIGSTSNPHSVTKAQVGLTNVTDDAQLKRAAADFATFTEKTTLAGSDLVLIEDSAAAGAKKKAQFSAFAGSALAVVQARRSTTMTMPATWTNITFDLTDVENNSAVLTHSTLTNTDRITIGEAGTYRVTYQFEVQPTATGKFEGRVYKNNTTVVVGSTQGTITYTNESDIISISTIADFAAGDYIVVQTQIATAGTMQVNATFTAQKLTGTKGDTGSGSSITVQDEGVPVAGTPHSTLDFQGDGVSVANGTGKAIITIPGGAIFGSQAQDVANETPASTTGTGWTTFLTLTTPSVPAGRYRVGWALNWRYGSTTNDFQSRLYQDGTTQIMYMQEEPEDAGADQAEPRGGFVYVTLTAAVHTFALQFSSSSAGTAATMNNARLEIWRVS